jgi:hypothetical protein
MELYKASEYLDFGRDCLRLADDVIAENQRMMLLHIAETWVRLAADLTKNLPTTRLH